MDREIHEKSWGYEEWIVNNEWYCGKKLVFRYEFSKTSVHFHAEKIETMFCLKGSFLIEMVKDGIFARKNLTEGESLDIPRFCVHRIVATSENSELIEFSTNHKDSDSYRIPVDKFESHPYP